MLPVVQRRRVAVGHDHVGERSSPQDRAQPIAVAVADVVQDQALDRVHRDPHLPVLPTDLTAVDVKARAVGLGDLEGLEVGAVLDAIGVVVARLGGDRHDAVVLDDGGAVVGVDEGHEALDRVGVVVVVGVLVQEGDRSPDPARWHLRWVDTRQPRLDVHERQVVDASLGERGQVGLVLEEDAVDVGDVLTGDRGLALVGVGEARHRVAGERYVGVEALAGLGVVADEPDHPGHVAVGQRCRRRLDAMAAGEERPVAEVARVAQDRDGAFELGRRGVVERMAWRFGSSWPARYSPARTRRPGQTVTGSIASAVRSTERRRSSMVGDGCTVISSSTFASEAKLVR